MTASTDHPRTGSDRGAGPTAEDLEEVRTLLEIAGLPASDTEIAVLRSSRDEKRRAISDLWFLAETRNAEPAMLFAAAPPLAGWDCGSAPS
jgi:hypothetical protein